MQNIANKRKATLLNCKNEISATKYCNINLIDFCFEAIEYSKDNDMTLKNAMIDLICEHIDKMFTNYDDFDASLSNQEISVLNLFLDANLFTTNEIHTQKALDYIEKDITKNIQFYINKRVLKTERQNKRVYLFA